MSTGAIGRLVKDRGFGFIKTGADIDLFFHSSQVQDLPFNSLKEGQTVQFNIILGPRGLNATDVKLAHKKPK
jgi:CspA family cold shock protein